MPYLRGVVVLGLDEAAVLAALLGRDERSRRQRLDGTTARTREIGLAALVAIEDGARAWSDQQAHAQNGHSDVRPCRAPAQSAGDDECTVAEAVELTGLCDRQVRRLAPQLGRKAGGRWRLSRREVLAFVEDRETRRSA